MEKRSASLSCKAACLAVWSLAVAGCAQKGPDKGADAAGPSGIVGKVLVSRTSGHQLMVVPDALDESTVNQLYVVDFGDREVPLELRLPSVSRHVALLEDGRELELVADTSGVAVWHFSVDGPKGDGDGRTDVPVTGISVFNDSTGFNVSALMDGGVGDGFQRVTNARINKAKDDSGSGTRGG